VQVFPGVAAGHDRKVGRRQVEGVNAARLDERHEAERFDARAERDEPVASPIRRIGRPSAVGLNNVATMFALHDPTADLADEDRRHRGALEPA